jgi:hypothetical protein
MKITEDDKDTIRDLITINDQQQLALMEKVLSQPIQEIPMTGDDLLGVRSLLSELKESHDLNISWSAELVESGEHALAKTKTLVAQKTLEAIEHLHTAMHLNGVTP